MSGVQVKPHAHGISVIDVDVDQFEFARRMAALTSSLDDSKSTFSEEIRAAAINCVQVMEQMVELLAGARVGEIYDLTE